MNTSKIAVVDSGVGGLNLLSLLNQQLPFADFHYISDRKYCPYGNKSEKEIQDRVLFLVEKAIGLNVDVIVLACNTATALGIDLARSFTSIPIVGIEPFITYQSKLDKGQKVALICTKLTAESKRLQALLNRADPQGLVKQFICLKLAGLIEQAFFKSEAEETVSLIEAELAKLKAWGPNVVLLGCTHYQLVAPLLERVLQAKVICPTPHVARRVLEVLGPPFSNLESMAARKKNVAFKWWDGESQFFELWNFRKLQEKLQQSKTL